MWDKLRRSTGVALLALGFLTAATADVPLVRAQIGAAPELMAPAAGVRLSGYAPDLQWHNPAGASQYQLQVTPLSGDGPALNLIRNAAEHFLLPPPPQWYGLLPDMTYTWRVRATDSTTAAPETDPSWSPWSNTRSFRTPVALSSALSLASPSDNSAVASLTPTLAWRSGDPNLWYFEIQISRDSSFNPNPATAIAPLYWELVHGGQAQPENSYTIPSDRQLVPQSTYSWRVRPRLQGDGTPVGWAQMGRFTTPGSTIITLDDRGKTFSAAVGTILQLSLPTSYVWTVSMSDPSVLEPLPALVPMPMPLRAKAAGRTTITAIGDLPCATSRPPCLAPSIAFTVDVIVHTMPVVVEPAPIERISVFSNGAATPEYTLEVQSGLPNGCYSFESAWVTRDGDVIRAEIYNSRPDQGQVACPQVYGLVTHSFNLGSSFVAGRRYSVLVNTQFYSFVA